MQFESGDVTILRTAGSPSLAISMNPVPVPLGPFPSVEWPYYL